MTAVEEASLSTSSRSSALVFSTLRIAVVILVAIAIIATFFDTATRATINPFNFFGFFTMQSNILTAVVLLIAAITTLRGHLQTPPLVLARACVTTCIVIVGIVYNTLLAGLEGGVSLEWANWVLHVAFPIYAALDWIFSGDHTAVPWKRLWVVLIFPAIWIVVVLIRGATDGWVPYPFLDPATGYGSVAQYSAAILIALLIVGAIVWALSRFQIIKPR